jgi:acetyltransferase-like isoleucine patch superfamily enzyme
MGGLKMKFFRASSKVDNAINIHSSIQPRVTIEGFGNYLSIEKPQSANNVQIHLTGNAHVSIKRGCALGHLFIYATAGSRVEIGEGVGFNGLVRLLLHEPRTIRIGADSLFGGGIDVTVSDMHSIVEADTGKRINHARDVEIAPRVWIGQNAMILKGANIGSDSIIGTGSIVTGAIPPNCVAAGNPARVMRRGVKWRRELIPASAQPSPDPRSAS